MTYGERLREAMEESADYKTASALSRAIKCSPQAIGHVLNGKTQALNQGNHTKACALLGVFPEWLSTGVGRKRPKGLLDEQSLPEPTPARPMDALDFAILEAVRDLGVSDKARLLTELEDKRRIELKKQA